MSVLKAELKKLMAHEIGVRVEDALEAAGNELRKMEARQVAFAEAAKTLEGLLPAVEADIKECKYPEEAAVPVRRYLGLGQVALQNMSLNAGNLRVMAAGKAAGLDQAVKLVAGILGEEQKKIEALKTAAQAAGAGTTGRDRLSGMRPESVKTQRTKTQVKRKAGDDASNS